VVSPFLWIEESIGRFAGYPPFVGCHPDDTHILLADLSGRRLADGAILVMGQLRYGTQFCSLEKESVKIGDFDPRHLLVLKLAHTGSHQYYYVRKADGIPTVQKQSKKARLGDSPGTPKLQEVLKGKICFSERSRGCPRLPKHLSSSEIVTDAFFADHTHF